MKTQILIFSLLVYLFSLQDARAQSYSLTQEGISEINRFLKDKIERGAVPAIEAIIVNRNEILYHEVFGKKDLHRNIDLAKGDLFDIASMTKQVTSAGIMMLHDEGKLDLDDPAILYIPALGDLEVLAAFDESDTTFTTYPTERQITIRHLLNQTSGMAYPWWDPRLRMIALKSGDARTLYYDYTTLPLLYQPGEDWSYGVSTRVAGHIIEAITEQTLAGFLAERLFEPLGMHNTFFEIPSGQQGRRVMIYNIEDGNWNERPLEHSHQSLVIGDGTLISTGEDYARFLQMLLNKGTAGDTRIQSEHSVELLTQNQIGDFFVKELFSGFPPGWGRDRFSFGFQITESSHSNGFLRSAGSYSWAGSYNTFFWGDPVHGIAVVVLMHYLPFFDETARKILDGTEERIYKNLEKR